PNIESLITRWSDHAAPVYLQTSPEYAMKRLLAAGSGPIYQFSKVFRYGERGRLHHPEFTMLEWYRPGFDHQQLLLEVDELVRKCLSHYIRMDQTIFWSYQQAWLETIGMDPFNNDVTALSTFVKEQNIDVEGMDDDYDSWLQLIMTHCVEPALPENAPVFIYDFPASQAALAKIRLDEPLVAERFELYINGMELANGFHELTDANEQRQRFESDLGKRDKTGKMAIPIDERLLKALPNMPACSGVAIGLDRLVMVAAAVTSIDEVLSFSIDE
ncbi:MAG: EF-P lysine aminoacylase EpmA, partial [Gammaproteobacteria bacterium]|nr:EF-P lysine aminoacylase EpmA [Gammaproteobacteria bacterium]